MTRYPNHSGFVAGSDTSAAAARHVDESGASDSQMLAVEFYLLNLAKYKGATADEIRQVLQGEWPHLHNAIVSARLSRLVNLGRVVKSIKTRKAAPISWSQNRTKNGSRTISPWKGQPAAASVIA